MPAGSDCDTAAEDAVLLAAAKRTRAGDGAVTPVFSDFEANRHDGERERNGGKANGKCKRDHHGIPFATRMLPGS